MRSFSILALAVAALAPFVGAAPTPVVSVAAAASETASIYERAVTVGGTGKGTASVHARLDASVGKAGKVGAYARETNGVAAILVDLKVELDVPINALKCLTKETATSDAITKILKDIISAVNATVAALKALVGAAQSDILCSLDGTTEVTVYYIAQLLADVLILIFGALGFVLSVVSNKNILVNALVSVGFGQCLCGLISAVLALVNGLIAALVPLVLVLIPAILTLGLNAVGSLLTIC